jgi:hypothetical protein
MGLREDQIAQAKAMTTPDGQRMFSDEQIDAHIKQLDLQKTFSRSVLDPNQPEPPSQIMRSVAQGLTFNTADEIEAYLRTLSGGDREAALRDIRMKLKNYQAASPIASTVAESVGSLPYAMLGAPAAATKLVPAISKVVGVGTAMGAASGAGRAEGDLYERGTGALMGGLTGGVGAAGVFGGLKLLGTVADPMLDFARRKIGDRGAKIVETEIQRIADATRLTPDEIVQGISNGQILSENAALLNIVRGYVSGGGDAAETIRQALSTRPSQLRQGATQQLQTDLTQGLPTTVQSPAGPIKPTIDPNVLRGFKQSELERTAALNAMYDTAYAEGGVVTEPMLSAFRESLKRSPSAVAEINKLHLAKTGQKPFFTVGEGGEITFVRPPNLQDMELARRGIQNDINQMWKSGNGDVAKELKPFELALRGEINTSSKAIADARQTASSNKTTSESFDAGKKAFGKSPDQISIDFEEIVAKGPDAVSAFRAGVMDQIRNRFKNPGDRTALLGKIADPELKEGAILRIIYPQDKVEGILKLATTAAQSQKAASYVLGGSATAATMAAAKQEGVNISSQEIASTLGGDLFTGMRVLGKFVSAKTPNLTPEQKQQVAKILVSEDPKIVMNALRDESGLAMLQQKIQSASSRFARTAPGLFSSTATPALQSLISGQ